MVTSRTTEAAISRRTKDPLRELTEPEREAELRLVTVPVEAGHYPPTLRDDQRVDLWVTPGPPSGTAARDAGAAPDADAAPDTAPDTAPPVAAEPLVLRGAQQVLSQVVVATGPVSDDLAGAGGTVPIVLQVRPDDVDEVWSNITAPVLLLTGVESWHVATLDEDALTGRFRDARHRFVDDAGHWIHHDQLDRFVQLVEDFLA